MGFAPVLRYEYIVRQADGFSRCPARKAMMSIDQFIDRAVKGNEVVLFMGQLRRSAVPAKGLMSALGH